MVPMQRPHPNKKNYNSIAPGMDDVVKSEGEGGKQKKNENKERGERGKVRSKFSEWSIHMFANQKTRCSSNARNHFYVDVSQHGRLLQQKKKKKMVEPDTT